VNPETGALILDILVGVGVLLAGIGILIGMLAMKKTLGRVDVTLDVVDQQLRTLGEPVAGTLAHIEGIADTADKAVGRLGGVADSLERVADTVAQTATLLKNAVNPAIVNAGTLLTGLSSGLRRLLTGKSSSD